ncbi:MAG: Ni/Fe hydrogenase subunit alpha [Candidatus Njordarchaeia archaeon]|nr:Ni/Fe hydrogenase subunit alpha [Candidatus Korarchaeota archaeon]
MKLLKIEPVSRLEGDARILILLDEEGKVQEAYFQVLEFKGFESFIKGRPAEEIPGIVTRICGVCPWAHHMAAGKAIDSLFGREPTETAKKIREMAYCAHILDSHTLHFYFLAGPDFLLSPDTKKSERNIIGIFKRNPEVVKGIVKRRKMITKIESIVGGKSIHPACVIPGGVSKKISENEQREIEEMAKDLIKFSESWLHKFENEILKKYEDVFFGDTYYLETYYGGLVDKDNKLNFYDGNVRIVSQKGKEVIKFRSSEYTKHIAEKVEPWTFTKFPYLKDIGWKGFVDGVDSGIYRVGPLGRLNACDGITTEKANEAYKRFYEVSGKPAHHSMLAHWARLIEMLYASERILELSNDEDITSENIVNLEGDFTGIGVGTVEAPRGLLIHHYQANQNAIITGGNIIIPTTMNNPAINIEIKKSASKLINGNKISDALLNRIEMAFRAYDPCLSCSVHSFDSGLPLRIEIYDSSRNLVKVVRR